MTECDDDNSHVTRRELYAELRHRDLLEEQRRDTLALAVKADADRVASNIRLLIAVCGLILLAVQLWLGRR